MLIIEEHRIKVSKYNINYYNSIGIDCKIDDIIKVKTDKLYPKSLTKIKYKCDLCGEIYEVQYKNYLLKKERVYNKEGDFCIHCNKKIRTKWYKENNKEAWDKENSDRVEKYKNTCLERYGETNTMKLESTREELRKVFIEKYGVDSPMKVEEIKRKLEDVMEEKYGYRNIFQSKEKQRELRRKAQEAKAKNNNCRVSKSQVYLSKLYNGECNKLVAGYWIVDILFEEQKIYCEYDGSGHKMNVKLGNITEEQYRKREYLRYHDIKKAGYKLFRIINMKLSNADKLPDDDILLQMKDIAFNYLSKEGNNNIVFNLDENFIKTKNNMYKWNYDDLFDENIQII